MSDAKAIRYALAPDDVWHGVKWANHDTVALCGHIFRARTITAAGDRPDVKCICYGCRWELEKCQRKNAICAETMAPGRAERTDEESTSAAAAQETVAKESKRTTVPPAP